MQQRQETLTVTLHWLGAAGAQSANVVCEDGPPAELLPLLLRGCGLPEADRQGRPRPYSLRLGSPAGAPLRPHERASQQGLRSGEHVWLVERGAGAARRCVLTLPDGSELLVPRGGVALTRAWLLQALALLNSEAHRAELARLDSRESPYRFVSNRTHCAITLVPGGARVSTDRADVVTDHNGAAITPGVAVPLRDGDRLTLGEGGLQLGVAFLGD